MFELEPHPSAPIKRELQEEHLVRYQLGPNRGLIPTREGDHAAYLVELVDDNDPANAKSWTSARKLRTAGLFGMSTLVASWGSSVYAAAIEPVSLEFHVGRVVATLGLTLYIIGFATGPAIFGPISEVAGRKTPLVIASFLFTCFMFGAATAKDFQTLMLCRFFAGVFASSPLVVCGGALTDLYGNETRGIAVTYYAMAVFVGPFISPIVGAFITQSYLGWRWTEYITGIMGALTLVLNVLFVEETNKNSILRRRAERIRKETGNFAVHHISEELVVTPGELMYKVLVLPIRLLFGEPIVFLVSLYTAFIYGIVYLFLEAYPIVFAELRHINPAVATLPYLGLITGVLIGCIICIWFEPQYNRRLRENNGIPVPEQRLLPMMVGAVFLPIGLFWFAWTGNYSRIHWIIPTLSGLFTGAGTLTIVLQALNYLVDSYLFAAASTIAASTMLRSFFGAAFPLFATQMFHNLGVQWAGSLLGFFALAFMPIPFLFYIYGPKLRRMSHYAPTDMGGVNMGGDNGSGGRGNGVMNGSNESNGSEEVGQVEKRDKEREGHGEV